MNEEHSEDIPLENVRLISYKLTLTSLYSMGPSPQLCRIVVRHKKSKYVRVEHNVS